MGWLEFTFKYANSRDLPLGCGSRRRAPESRRRHQSDPASWSRRISGPSAGASSELSSGDCPRCQAELAVPGAAVVVLASSEFQPQCHLHYALVRERASVHTEGIRVVNSIAHGHSVETHAVGHVEHVPPQAEVDALGYGKVLPQTRVQRKIAVTA